MEEKKPGHPETPLGHEITDAHAPSIVKFAIGLALVILLSLYAMARLADYFGEHQVQLGPQPSPLVRTRQVPPLPQLQVSPGADLNEFRAVEDSRLDSYGWVDRQTGIIRIPIDRAMDLVAERGLPVRGETKEKSLVKGKK
ncbi:MAG: hypothetical protein LAO31_18245 [Acidobacteriia bacterium]|nr:hypothetical protein [Terriglobia bacterium]